MVKGVHAMFYSPKAEELREFFRDKLGLDYYDAGSGWLIFRPSEGEIGFHPASECRHEISLYCEDIVKTVEELREKQVEFSGPIEDHGYGFVTLLKAPGDLTIQLFQPKH